MILHFSQTLQVHPLFVSKVLSSKLFKAEHQKDFFQKGQKLSNFATGDHSFMTEAKFRKNGIHGKFCCSKFEYKNSNTIKNIIFFLKSDSNYLEFYLNF